MPVYVQESCIPARASIIFCIFDTALGPLRHTCPYRLPEPTLRPGPETETDAIPIEPHASPWRRSGPDPIVVFSHVSNGTMRTGLTRLFVLRGLNSTWMAEHPSTLTNGEQTDPGKCAVSQANRFRIHAFLQVDYWGSRDGTTSRLPPHCTLSTGWHPLPRPDRVLRDVTVLPAKSVMLRPV